MVKTFRKFTKEHRAKISAAAKKRWAEKRKPSVETIHEAVMHTKRITAEKANELFPSNQWATEFAKLGPDTKIGTQLRIRLPNTDGLISRMTQAIDKIETQIKRLESL